MEMDSQVNVPTSTELTTFPKLWIALDISVSVLAVCASCYIKRE